MKGPRSPTGNLPRYAFSIVARPISDGISRDAPISPRSMLASRLLSVEPLNASKVLLKVEERSRRGTGGGGRLCSSTGIGGSSATRPCRTDEPLG